MIMPRYFSPPRLRINARRLGWFFCLLAIVPVAMMIAGIWRLYDLHPQLQRELKEIYEVHRVIPSHRGTITDRNGMPLAQSPTGKKTSPARRAFIAQTRRRKITRH